MRPNNVNIIVSQSAALSANGEAIPTAQVVSASAQIVATGTAAGTFKWQASNDNVFAPNVPVNWTDVPGSTSTVTVSGVNSYLLPKVDVSYNYMRAIYTSTATVAQTVALIADTGVRQVQTVTTVADTAGSLNSKWFSLSSLNQGTKAAKNFYMWFDDGSGVDPAPAGKTAIHVTYTIGDTASTIATAMRSALNALSSDFVASGATNVVTITNKAPGLVGLAADGTAATGFTFANTTPGVASNLNSKYFLLASTVKSYYVWMNVDSIGVDPALSGVTACPVAFAAGATAATIGTALASAVAALNATIDFSTSGTSTVTITDKVAGPAAPASDVNTGFAFVLTAPTGTITANMQTFGF